MPTYDYECGQCREVREVLHGMSEKPDVLCCQKQMKRVILTAPGTVIPPNMQASPSKCAYYGVRDILTGEGITENTDVRDPAGVRVKSPRA